MLRRGVFKKIHQDHKGRNGQTLDSSASKSGLNIGSAKPLRFPTEKGAVFLSTYYVPSMVLMLFCVKLLRLRDEPSGRTASSPLHR